MARIKLRYVNGYANRDRKNGLPGAQTANSATGAEGNHCVDDLGLSVVGRYAGEMN
jgi:hypothetical protein